MFFPGISSPQIEILSKLLQKLGSLEEGMRLASKLVGSLEEGNILKSNAEVFPSSGFEIKKQNL